MSRFRVVHLAAVAVLATGCAGVPSVPRDFDMDRAAMAVSVAPPQLVLDGTEASIAGGTAKGAGAGLLATGLLCGMFGPLAPLCFATYLTPTVVVSGLVGGASVAVRQDSREDLQAKRSLLDSALKTFDTSGRLVGSIQRYADDAARDGRRPVEAPRQSWIIKVTTLRVGTVGTGAAQPFSLVAAADLEMSRAGESTPAFVRSYQVRGAERKVLDDWAAGDAAGVHAALDAFVVSLSAQIACDLAQSDAQRSRVPVQPAGTATAGAACKPR